MATRTALTWKQFLEETAATGEVINLMFEERLFNLVGILQKIAEPLAAANIPYEIIGGLAVLIHVEEVDPSQAVLTRDVDILIRRSDLDRVIAAAESGSFNFDKRRAWKYFSTPGKSPTRYICSLAARRSSRARSFPIRLSRRSLSQ